MTTYTGVADANGDFTVPFSSNYTSGQKITVTAEKDSATKSIELFAPSDTTGGGVIQFTGNLTNFPVNIGNIVLTQLSGSIANSTFDGTPNNCMYKKATGLDMSQCQITSIGSEAFYSWSAATSLALNNGLQTIGNSAFYAWASLIELIIPDSVVSIGDSAFSDINALQKLTIGSACTTIADYAFSELIACNEIVMKPLTPPAIQTYTLQFLKSTCVIKVPAASLSAYQAAAKWSAHASKMVGV